MSRLFDALENARALVAPAESPPPRLPGGATDADLPILRLWQAVETRLAERPQKVIQIAPCAGEEADPAVAVRFARLAGKAMGKEVVVLDGTRSRGDGDGEVTFGPLPGRSGDARELNPELLRAYWQKLTERADLVVLDAPPVLASPLTLALAPTVDGVILMIEAERTRRAVAAAARDQLVAAGANILGVVFTRRRFHVPKAIYDRL